jgi:transposase
MRYELSDYEWTAIKPMLPNKPRGVQRVDDRRVLNGIFWVLRSGAPWRDLPENRVPALLVTIASFGFRFSGSCVNRRGIRAPFSG